jgi:DNA repair protein SbcC/Rad50
MRPLRLLLDGFGCYRQPTDVDFSDVDFFALTGPTGSGKSTLIDGLCFALYGTVPRWGKENAIAHALAPAANACRVCLIFEAGGKRYAAVRALARDKKGKVHTKEARLELLSADVAVDAPLEDLLAASAAALAEGPDEVKARVQEILGLSYEHFTQSVLLPQGQFAEFLHAKPGDRQNLLVELLAFGVYDTVGQRARERAKLAGAAAQTVQRELAELAFATPDAVAALADRVAVLGELESSAAERMRSLDSLRHQAAEAAQEVASCRKSVELLADVRVPGTVSGLARRLADADERIASAERVEAEASAAEIAADRLAAELPERSAVEARLARLRDRREIGVLLTSQVAAADKAARAEQASAAGLIAAETAQRDAVWALEQARDEHAAAHLAAGLAVGVACPVCLRPVDSISGREAPASPELVSGGAGGRPPEVILQAAETAVALAERQLKGAQDAARRARDAATKAGGAADGTRERFIRVVGMLEGVPSADDPTADLSSAEELVADELARVDAAARDLRGCRASARASRNELDAARKARSALAGEEQQAWASFRRTRDALVLLDAPAADGTDLAAAWQVLSAWATERHAAAAARLKEADADAMGLHSQVAAGEAALAAMLVSVGLTVGAADPLKAAAAIASARAKAEADLSALQEAVQRATVLSARVKQHQEEEQVATMLGNLLRATAFERWLCGEALDTLVAEASQMLMELSGGQYQLDRDDRNELVVIDYQDAAASRPVHTLSGGETFQASLALALALSRQVVSLSAGLRDLNSMFLDEGFGTLDEDTLETVAATLERLAADSDRMVGVITHVPALAERVPVRFVVSRDAGTSAIRKERSA